MRLGLPDAFTEGFAAGQVRRAAPQAVEGQGFGGGAPHQRLQAVQTNLGVRFGGGPAAGLPRQGVGQQGDAALHVVVDQQVVEAGQHGIRQVQGTGFPGQALRLSRAGRPQVAQEAAGEARQGVRSLRPPRGQPGLEHLRQGARLGF